MKLSTKARYGLRLMFQLALEYGKGPVSLKDISRKEDISEKYLSQIVIPLKARGLVIPIRGSSGGYVLAREPFAITVKDIVEVFEGSFTPVECTEHPSACNRASFCTARKVWSILGDKMAETLNSLNLKDLINMDEKNKEDFLDYSI
ncbi:MAG: Rrf2 family transcriptional regulator [Candidatus Eremiobacterota bacterium]